jgi:hypothetical protein
MTLRFLIDENLLGRLWRAVARHNAGGANLIDAVQVGDIPDLPRTSDDVYIQADVPPYLLSLPFSSRLYSSRTTK